MNEELLRKAGAAKSPEELLKLAHEIGMEDLTEENAKEYFEFLHKSGELSDDELEQAAGGCKTGSGRRVVTRGYICPDSLRESWLCRSCRKNNWECTCGRAQTDFLGEALGVCGNFNAKNVCGSCAYCTYEGGKWYCNNEKANAK